MILHADEFLEDISYDGAYQKISASEFLSRRDFDYDRKGALFVCDVGSVENGKLFRKLSELLGSVYGAFYVAKEGGKLEKTELSEESLFSAYCCAALPLSLTEREKYGFSDLMEIMRILRGENGCHWDRAQTHESIRNNAIEEAYELVNAIDNRDAENIAEEAGDVVLQGVFHAVIGDEAGEFAAADVVSGLCAKLVSRHTHIYNYEYI